MKHLTHILRAAAFAIIMPLSLSAQEKAEEIMEEQIDIHVIKDGKTMKRSYSSREEMENDEDLKEFMGEEGLAIIQAHKMEVAGDNVTRNIRIVKDGDDNDVEIILSGNDEDKEIYSIDRNVVVMTNGGDPEVDVYELTGDADTDEEVSKIINKYHGRKMITVIKDKDYTYRADKEDGRKGFVKSFDIEADLKRNTLDLAFEANEGPALVTIKDADDNELYRKNLPDFDGSFEETIELKRFRGRYITVTIEQNGDVMTEKINLD